MRAVTEVSTEPLPPAERFAYWSDLISHTAIPLQLRSEEAKNFVGRIRVMDLGDIQLNRFQFPRLEAVRTAKLIRQSDPEQYQLALGLNGKGVLTQDRRTSVVGRNDFTFYSSSRPHNLRHEPSPGRTDSSAICIFVPYARMPLPLDRAARLHACRISGGYGMGALLSRFLIQLTRHPEQYGPADAARLSTITLDLVMATLAQQLDMEECLPEASRQRALLARVKAFVQQNLADPELSPATIAAAHHVSTRSLHRLFQSEETTLSRWIREQRVERCRRDLVDPRLAHRSIQAIAASWGFTDSAHFSRLFRATYGMSASDYRHQRQLHVLT